jgi:hypothetical protein
MKKLVITAMLLSSMAAFAENGGTTYKNGMIQQQSGMMQQQNQMMQQSKTGMGYNAMQQTAALSPEQKIQLEELHLKYLNKVQDDMLKIRELNLELEKELLAESVDTKKIDKLIDKKAQLQAKIEKNMIDFRIEAKEKIGISISGGMMWGYGQMMGGMNNMNSMHQMMGNMHEMMDDMYEMMGDIDYQRGGVEEKPSTEK